MEIVYSKCNYVSIGSVKPGSLIMFEDGAFAIVCESSFCPYNMVHSIDVSNGKQYQSYANKKVEVFPKAKVIAED